MSKLDRLIALAALTALCLAGLALPVKAEEPPDPLKPALDLFVGGERLQAAAELTRLLQAEGLSASQRTEAHKLVGLCYTLEGQELPAVTSFKALVKENRRFTFRDLAVLGEDPPIEAVRYFTQAEAEVRQEEIDARTQALMRTSPASAMLRSLVLPGWGQRYQGFRMRGYLVFGVAAATVGYATLAESDFRDARDAYAQAPVGADFDRLYSDYRNRADRADLAMAVLGGVWVINALDAAMQGPNVRRGQLGLIPAAGSGARLVYARSF